MKKKIVIAVGTVAVLFGGYCVAATAGLCKVPEVLKQDSEELLDGERISQILKESKPTEIFILGKEIPFEQDITYTQLENLSEEALNDTEKEYKVIIINDLDNSVSISNEEIEMVKEQIEEDGTMLLYLGEKYATTWDKSEKGIANVDGNLCYAYYSWNGNEKRAIGGWDESDQNELEKYPYSLGQSLLYSIEDYIQEG